MQSILAEKQLDNNRASWAERLQAITADQVKRELSNPAGKFSLARLVTLLSPAAEPFLETMAQQAHALTIQRFGKTIQLYAPLYVSNVCINSCRYCGYNQTTQIERTRLTIEQAVSDAAVIAGEGFRHLLLVSGEDTKFVSPDYLCELAGKLRQQFSSLSIEIYAMSQDEYAQLFNAGIDGVTLYQETYDRDVYADYHPAGPKADYDSRLDAPDRFASAGMRRIGLGFLLGLTNWRIETLALAEHASYLIKKYWRSQISFSFPRICPATNVQSEWPHLVSDTDMVQMMLALRLCFSDAGIVLSTRETPEFRDNLINLCVTRLSAGSKTNPGGYASETEAAEQFEVADSRSPEEVARMIRSHGYEAVWKDWDVSFNKLG
ncbi:MAG: 2-iminoacetate synthase ThiH [Planctomycetales bacterium 4572_13]|nr:MAG: 2-iminoacetate synthase ThiH [Planctomycetales bacterium 4572_13]